jgi:hypothetical protein
MQVRRLFLCAMTALWLGWMLVAVPSVLADDPNRSSQLKISVWPEYDQPTVLVMLDGVLADGTNLPREITVNIPSGATQLVTTFANSDGTFAPEQPSQATDLSGGYRQIRYTVSSAKYHVEYYDNLLRGSPEKAMDFSYQASAPIDLVTLAIQQPLKATNFAVTPTAEISRDDNGFNIYTRQFSNLIQGQVLTAQVTYTKSDSIPSVVATAVPAALPVSAPSGVPGGWSLAYAVIAAALLVIVGVVGWNIFQRGGRIPVRASAGGKGATVVRPKRGGEDVQFCTQCGRELRPDDSFCPKCGAKRRTTG